MRQIINNDLRAEKADNTHWMYLDRMKEPGKDEVKQVVETNLAKLELVTSRGGYPVSSNERKKEMQKLQRLATNPEAEGEALRSDREDSQKAQRMLRMLPDAFRYHIENRQGDRVMLAFTPDPNFRPATREAMVFHGMAGTLVLDVRQERLAEIRGHLIDDVKFGWGVLGHLDRGGQFVVMQSPEADGYWEITELDVQMTGKALFFKSINLHQQEWRSQYRRLPDNLPPQQGLAMLANTSNTVAQK